MQRSEGAVVVGLDGSAGSLRALRWAAEHAATTRRPLQLVHAVHTVTSAYADGTTGVRSRAVLETSGRRLLADACARVEQAAPGVEVEETPALGDPRETLLRLSEHADVVVVGSRGLGALRSAPLRSVGVALLRRSRCPVVVVRPRKDKVTRHGVVVGLEVAASSAPVLELAYRMASLRRQPLTLLHGTGDAYVGTTGAYRTVEAAAEAESDRLAISETCAGFASRYPEVVVSARTARGRPEQALIEASEDADLLVLGAHQHALPRRILAGSVSTAVLEHAACTVAVVPLGRERW